MNGAVSTGGRESSFGEEIANSVSHGVGFLAALVASPFLVLAAAQRGGFVAVVGASVFAGTMAALYLASTLYHVLPRNKAKRVFRVLDHSAIFLLIAGTYTPFTLGVLRGAWGWTLFGLVWSLAVIGLTMKAVFGHRFAWLSVVLYLTMGWLVVIAAPQVMQRVPMSGLAWILAGGIAYTGGVAFYAAHRVRYAHFAWHM